MQRHENPSARERSWTILFESGQKEGLTSSPILGTNEEDSIFPVHFWFIVWRKAEKEETERRM